MSLKEFDKLAGGKSHYKREVQHNGPFRGMNVILRNSREASQQDKILTGFCRLLFVTVKTTI